MLKLYVAAQEKLRAFKQEISGATAIEYGLIAAGIGVVILAGIGILGPALNNLFVNISGKL